jgi:sigma-E factor negative regulatory protein RseA
MVMENISVLMDGELDQHESQGQLKRLKSDPGLARGWHDYHLIGDAMRGERPLSAGFNERLAARMAAEPTVLAPQRTSRRSATAYALSAAASISAVALVGWVAFVNYPEAPAPQIAQVPSLPSSAAPPVIPAATAITSPAAAAPQPQLASVSSEGKMNEYLMAHQEFSPSTAIQGLAPYIRSVSTTQGR